MRPIKLMMTADAVGGVFTYALDLAAGLAPHGIETTLVVLGPAMNAAQRAAASSVPGLAVIQSGLPLDWLAADEAGLTAAAAAVAAIAARAEADLVHLNTPALAVASYAVPVVAAAHSCVASWWAAVRGGELPDDFVWRTRAMARGLGAADAVVCPSRTYAETLSATYAVAATAVHNGRAGPPAVGADAPLAQAFTAGRLWDEGKNIGVLDAAAALTGVRIAAAGPLDGPDGTHTGLLNVHRMGVLSDPQIRGYLAAKPIFVSTARYEPFGLAVLEAAQAGCPLVLSDIPTFRELWSGAALFTPVDDPAAVAAALDALAADRGKRVRMGEAARARAGRYSVEAMAAGLVEIYRRVHPNLALDIRETAA
ncbi:glycosyltransferase family 4 protein [Chelatococcus reniformis]|uniref:glycosyltransferase family 4 protein n=1 Tax=Chelatococcus reniformis TaxID=1494448 RepID=UPI001FCF0C24|nr:glycosyltransferase family 4 protein [Chelatococcus reniformis]